MASPASIPFKEINQKNRKIPTQPYFMQLGGQPSALPIDINQLRMSRAIMASQITAASIQNNFISAPVYPMKASGPGHLAGLTPDPGITAGITKFLREDATFSVPPTLGASGGSHAQGYAPDPGSVAGIKRFLREDATWQIPPTLSPYKQQSFYHVVDGSTGWSVRGGSGDITFGGVATVYDTDGLWEHWTSGAVNTNQAGRMSSGAPGFSRANRNFVMHMRMKTGTSLSHVRYFHGIANSNPNTAFVNGGFTLGFAFDDATDATHWLFQTQNLGGPTSVIGALSATIAVNTAYNLMIDASTYTVDGKIKFLVNDILAGTITPGAEVIGTQDLDPAEIIETLNNVAKDFYIGPGHIEQY